MRPSSAASSLDIIKEQLQLLETNLIAFLKTPNDPTNQILEHIFKSGGKRIRPTLFLLSAELVNYRGDHLFPLAAVCEYIHTASLLHDDVIDNSTLRRNKPTVNSIWGDETAILSGDLIYSTACQLLVKAKNLEIIGSFTECIRKMSESELYQLELLWNKETTIEQYYKLIYGKTAILFEASIAAPGLLQGCSTEMMQLLNDYGRYLGYTFQIVDDCLDYSADSLSLGKPVCGDLLEGKFTLPLILGLESSTNAAQELKNLVENILDAGIDAEKKESLIRLIHETKGIEKAFDEAKKYTEKAVQCIDKLQALLPATAQSRQAGLALQEIAQIALNRKN